MILSRYTAKLDAGGDGSATATSLRSCAAIRLLGDPHPRRDDTGDRCDCDGEPHPFCFGNSPGCSSMTSSACYGCREATADERTCQMTAHAKGLIACGIVAVLAVAALGAHLVVWGNDGSTSRSTEGRSAPVSVNNYIWRYDLTEGIAVGFVMRPDGMPSRPAQNIKIVASLAEDLSDDWEIAGAVAYIVHDGKRHEANFEGPYLQEHQDDPPNGAHSHRGVVWNMYRVGEQPYEIDVLLHRKSERLTFQETRDLIEKHGALHVTFTSFIQPQL